MKKSVLDYYQRELNYLRRRGQDFAANYPKIAARLQLNDEMSRDPHIERLIQGVAFLNAKIRKNIDDDFPQLCQSILDVIYPHYLRPIPSHTVVNFVPDDDASGVVEIPAGTQLHTHKSEEHVCTFRTIYDTQLLPIRVQEASLKTYPVVAPKTRFTKQISSILKIVLRTTSEDILFSDLDLDRIRLYIKGGRYYSHALYELLCNNLIQMAVTRSYDEPEVLFIDGDKAVSQVGFSTEEGMLPYPRQSFIGYRLLTEYFAFPEKFMFIDLHAPFGNERFDVSQLELYFYLNRNKPDIEATIDADNFVVNATPIINLFEQISEPIRLDNLGYEYALEPDVRHPEKIEVYTVNDVLITDAQDKAIEARPFFGISHAFHGQGDKAAFWHIRREEQEIGERRTESFLTFVNLDMSPVSQPDWIVMTRLSCFNGNIPRRLSQLSTQPKLTLQDGGAAIQAVVLNMPFTEVIRPRLDEHMYWKLLSHLNLNYLSLADREEGSEALREILNLYNYRGTSEVNSVIDSVTIDKVTPINARVVGDNGQPYFCRGNRIRITLDQEKMAGGSPYLFACVLERFLALYTNVNSFVKLEVQLSQEGELLKSWTPRAGEQCLI